MRRFNEDNEYIGIIILGIKMCNYNYTSYIRRGIRQLNYLSTEKKRSIYYHQICLYNTIRYSALQLQQVNYFKGKH